MARLFHFVFAIVSCVYAASAAPLECTYACPLADSNGQVLVMDPSAIPYTGVYSIFDCVYGTPQTKLDPLKCSYYKASGLLALSAAESLCPPQALSCAAIEEARYSAPEKVETPPWIDNAKNLLWIQSHL
ncbi:hypothetical protein BD779DRAFT_1513269 [Infundibulicybe gibba]|nr:hypothetical protein BD779DRAFT_1513269 [Infundibulicybe gibba]